jgi:arsenate reductase (thioredoxin)
MIRVLFICVHNSARSQMAEEYLRRFGGIGFHVESAGLEPGTLNPHVVRALQEDGIDITGKKTNSVAGFFKEGRTYRYVITVCSKEAAERCPIFPGITERLHWPFPDPSTFTGSDVEIMNQVRALREAIKTRVKEFIEGVPAEN